MAILTLDLGDLCFEGFAGFLNAGMDGLKRVRLPAMSVRKLASVRP